MKCIIDLHFSPLLSTYSMLAGAEEVIFEACENYQKGSFRNKTYIAGPNGHQLLTVPLLKGKHDNTSISGVEIAYHQHWMRNHLRSIKTAYGSTAFFEYYFPAIREIYNRKFKHLWSLNRALFEYINTKLENSVNYSFSREYIHSYEDKQIIDLRDAYSPTSGKIPMPQIKKNFSYSQVLQDRYGFRANVSILDLLFHCGPEAVWKIAELKTKISSSRI